MARDFSIFEQTAEERAIEEGIFGRPTEPIDTEIKVELTGRYSGDRPIILEGEEYHQTTLEVLLTDEQYIELMKMKSTGGTFCFKFATKSKE